MILVTAASQSYFGALANLVGSLAYWNPEHRFVIYDLGLGDKLLDEVKKWQNVTLVMNFLDSNLPGHCKLLKEYAWKPFVIEHAIERYGSALWIDAGSDIRAPIDPVFTLLTQQGYFFVKGQDLDMTKKSHAATYHYLGLNKLDFIAKEHFSANLQGYTHGSLAHQDILIPMVNAAAKKQCIAPPGSNLSNHRYDQTLLSLVAYTRAWDVVEHTVYLAAQRNQLSNDPTLPSDKIVFTARGSSRDYVRYLRDYRNLALYQDYVK
jgi:hypothetical protein